MDLKNHKDPWDQWPLFMICMLMFYLFSAKDDEDAEIPLLHSKDWMNSQGIAENAKCGRFCKCKFLILFYRIKKLNISKEATP